MILTWDEKLFAPEAAVAAPSATTATSAMVSERFMRVLSLPVLRFQFSAAVAGS